MTFWNIVAAAAALVSIASVCGMALNRGYTTSLRESLTLANENLAKQDDKITQLEQQGVKDRETIADQAHDIKVLQGVVTGEVQLQIIHDTLDAHHIAAEAHWDKTQRVLDEILTTLRRPA